VEQETSLSSKEKQISLIRVLIALAWADGQISHEEMNFLKDFMFKFDFTGEEWAQIEMYMEDPVTPEEAEALIQDFIQKIGPFEERQAVLSALEGLMQADGMTTSEEREFLSRFTGILQQTLSPAALLNGIRGLFRQTVFKPVHGSKRSEELHDFLNNRVLFKVRRKLEREKLSLETHPDQLAYATLFGGLLAHVASVHKAMGTKELAILKRHLQQIAGFDEEATELILSVIQETAARGLDRFRLTREFYEKSTDDQHLQLLDCLFDIAGSDIDLQHSEIEEVRTIAYGLKLSHREFIQAKLKYLEKMAGSK
jgi:uncharacterized tellurite resistance protein B-like protein